MRPFGNGTNCYEVRTVVNGKQLSMARVAVDWAPYDAEMDVLHRMGVEIVRELREQEEHKGCCDCCNVKKSKCPKY